MSDLHNLQIQFQNYLFHKKSSIEKQIKNSEKLTTEARLQIYREMYFLRLFQVLKNNYPILNALMGENEFKKLSHAYIDTHFSTAHVLRIFGKNLAKFLQETHPYSLRPWLYEIAQFECVINEVFFAPNITPMILEDMSSISAENWPYLIFKLHPSVQRLNFSWNVVALWEAYTNNAQIIYPEYISRSFLIWRKEYSVKFCPLTKDEIFMLDAMQAGKTFEAICEGLALWVDESKLAMHAASLLKRFFVDGLVIAAVYSEPI